MKVESVRRLLEEYQIMEEEESLQLLTDLEPIFSPFKSEGQACVLKNEVTSTYSRCIACYHGQGIKRFDYNYLNIDAPHRITKLYIKIVLECISEK